MSDDIAADLRSYTERFELSPRIQGKLMLEAADEIERLRERLGPRGLEVVQIDGAGHYVNVKVKTEIERLQKDNKHWQAVASQGITIERELRVEIERLRGENEKLRGHIYASNRPQPEEVERLRIDNDRLREGRDTMGNLWAKETAENSQLRTALRKITDLIDSEANEPLDEAIKIAMDALVN